MYKLDDAHRPDGGSESCLLVRSSRGQEGRSKLVKELIIFNNFAKSDGKLLFLIQQWIVYGYINPSNISPLIGTEVFLAFGTEARSL